MEAKRGILTRRRGARGERQRAAEFCWKWIMAWRAYEGGASIGGKGSEDGEILRGEEHARGERITLERTLSRPYSHAITCGVYGWMVHTCFADSDAAAQARF